MEAQDQTATALPVPQRKPSEYKFFALCNASDGKSNVVEGSTKAELRRNLAENPQVGEVARIFRGREIKFKTHTAIKL